MLNNLIIQSSDSGLDVVYWIEMGATVIEVLAVIIILVGILYSTFRYGWRILKKEEERSPYRAL